MSTDTITITTADLAELDRRFPGVADAIRSSSEPAPAEVDLGAEAMLTGRQVAERLGVSVRTVEGWRRVGGGPPWVRVGRGARYSSRELARWVAEGSPGGPPPGHRATDHPPQSGHRWATAPDPEKAKPPISGV